MIVQYLIMKLKNIKTIRIAIVIVIIIRICVPAQSQELPDGQAVEIASSFWNIENVRNGEDNSFQIKECKRNGKTYLYIVSNHEKGSLIIVNEQRLNGIVGYFDDVLSEKAQEIPPAFNTLLQLYMDVVDSVRTATQYRQRTNPYPSMRTVRGTIVVNPLLEDAGNVIWKQQGNHTISSTQCDYHYNKFAPAFNIDLYCGKGYAGCTAVAMAQIMWYWQWPDYAWIKPEIERITGLTSGTPTKHYYDWTNMPTAIYDTTNLYRVDAVTGFLRDCGYAAYTKYWAEGSAATVGDARDALRDTFDYHVTDTHEYPWTQISPILQSDLGNGYPIFCQAWSDNKIGAHSFVVDGYNTDGTYHINFGWGGYMNGWYDLDFDEWNDNRTFLTEIYPNCSRKSASINGISQTSVNNGQAIVQYSQNDISFCTNGNVLNVENGGHLVAKAGNQIRLVPGFHAKSGSNVRLSVGDICHGNDHADVIGNFGSETQVSARIDAPNNRASKADNLKQSKLSVSPNPVTDILSVRSAETLQMVRIYNLNGQCLLQTAEKEINVSMLPVGLYLLTAQTSSGESLQTKFIKQ